MKTTSHFIGIQLKSEFLADIFLSVYRYVKENNIEDSILFQNPLSPHITLYYLEKNIDDIIKNEIKKDIKKIDVNDEIKISGFDYFFRGEGNRFVLYFKSKTNLPLEDYRNDLHQKYNRDYIEDNSFSFSPHITFLKIKNNEIFEKHRENIENIIKKELEKINNLDLNTKKVFLYAVNSQFKEEIQIKN